MSPTPTGLSALAWTTTVVAAVTVAARMYVRTKLHAIGNDDWFMVMALVWAICTAAISQSVYSNWPYDGHYSLDFWTKHNMSPICTFFSTLCGKTSVGLLLLRVISPNMKFHRWVIGLLIGGLWITTFFALLQQFFPQCTKELMMLKSIAGCLPPQVSNSFYITWSFYGMFIDIIFSTFPAFIIHRMKLSKGKKISISVLLGLGWIAAIFTLMKVIGYFHTFSQEWRDTVLPLATFMEQALVMICGSLATLTPLYRYWTTGEMVDSHQHLSPAHTRTGQSKHSIMGKGSMSTISGGRSVGQPDSTDEPVPGSRVDRDVGAASQPYTSVV